MMQLVELHPVRTLTIDLDLARTNSQVSDPEDTLSWAIATVTPWLKLVAVDESEEEPEDEDEEDDEDEGDDDEELDEDDDEGDEEDDEDEEEE